jgi:hypothetical protein
MPLSLSAINRDIAVLSVRRFQRSYGFEVLLPQVGWVPGELVAPTIQDITYSDYVMKEPTSMRSGAYKLFYVNDLQDPVLKIIFLETEEGAVRLYLNAWRSLMLTNKGLWRKKLNGYAKNITLTYLTAEGIPLRVVNFRNAFPLKFYDAALSYKENTIQQIEVPFACDMVEEGILGSELAENVGAELLSFGQSLASNILSEVVKEKPGGVNQGTSSWGSTSIISEAAIEERQKAPTVIPKDLEDYQITQEMIDNYNSRPLAAAVETVKVNVPVQWTPPLAASTLTDAEVTAAILERNNLNPLAAPKDLPAAFI